DLVSYTQRHNAANGEGNRDGHEGNHSGNFGVEGETADPVVLERRRRVQRTLLATLLLAQGTPMLAAGSELGHTQRGNNNAYCQDNEISWLDWEHADGELRRFVVQLVRLRRTRHPLGSDWHAETPSGPDMTPALGWFGSDGTPLAGDAWHDCTERAFFLTIGSRDILLFNPGWSERLFSLPPGAWQVLLDSAEPQRQGERVSVAQHELGAHGLQWLTGVEE
ncbi:MAG: glycogen debranching enzyme GlgX, partial [Gammaproteobacteria bacterium]|nr:glycogen debranching enzyme GlgX [Gammaproteobacteria bacterium]